MDLHITGKSAIVCASSKGLGKASALALAKEGVNVWICGRHQEALDAAAERQRQRIGRKNDGLARLEREADAIAGQA